MKLKIRKGVFETNSSSCHSISINSNTPNYAPPESLYVNYETNRVSVSFGEFGWEIESYYGVGAKLEYLITMVAETEGNKITTVEEFYETEGYKLINDSIANYCKCDGIELKDGELKMRSYTRSDGSICTYLNHEGYIDHQSTEDYSSLKDFLDSYGLSVIDFVFNRNIAVHTDNDNH